MIRTYPGFVQCGGCAYVRREMGQPDTSEGTGVCLFHVESDPDTQVARYRTVKMGMPDGFDQADPWSPEHRQLAVGGCFQGRPVEWDTIRRHPDDFLKTHDLSDS